VEAKTTINYLLVEDKWCHSSDSTRGTARASMVQKRPTGIFDIAGVETGSHIRKVRDGKSTVFHIAFSAIHVPFEGKPHFRKAPPRDSCINICLAERNRVECKKKKKFVKLGLGLSLSKQSICFR
jgi:hypothetical protein